MQKFLARFRRTVGEGPLRLRLGALLVLLCLVVELVLLLPGFEMSPVRVALFALNVVILGAVLYLFASLFAWERRARKKREEQLTDMSRRLELALEVSRIGFWDADLDTDTLQWDARACQHMGVPYRGGAFTEADWLAAVHPDDRERALEAAEQAIETGGRFISDYRVVWPGGEVRHLRDMAAFYRGGFGRRRIAGLVWDVTSDKEREAELELRRHEAEAADKAKSSFLAAMSHEIRTPLGGVIGMLDLMQDDEIEGEQAERVKIARSSAQTLLHLLNDVLDMTKLEAEAVQLCPVPTEIRPLVAEIGDLMAARARQKSLSLSWDVDEAVPGWLRVDPVRLRQVLTNLVSNAVTYTDAGSVEVRVGWARHGGWTGLEVTVRDSGIGISGADLDRIFERFVQTEASVRRQAGGTGLGLAIARELVELMGGSIGVVSEIGRGSTFTFTALADPCEAPIGQGAAAGIDAPACSLSVLVAEDNGTNRLLISSLLGRGGHRVTVVQNGREAVDAVAGGSFDVVLMDVQMPEMDGISATRAIRALGEPAAATPIVALTASVLSDDRSRYLEAGMDECLAKPIEVAALNGVLCRLAAKAIRESAARVA